MWKKHRNKIIPAVAIIAVLVAAFFMGGDLGETKELVQEVSMEAAPEVAEETKDPEPETEEPPAKPEEPEESSEQEQTEPEENEPTVEETETEESTMEIAPEAGKDQYQTDPVPEGMPEPVEPQEAEVTNTAYTCTISISCATILDNMDVLADGKDVLVPADGWILPATTVTFYEGESVFDVLLRVCQENKIHMEYMDTPMYNSAYIEGINNLYEFDCGNLSGWMYHVNGWFPNYGCSRYALQDGDVICWVYTCDLGADVGDNSMSN